MPSKKTIEDCNNLAKKHGGLCISKVYINAYSHLQWKCAFGHIWWAKYHVIYSGSWCPECSGCKQYTMEDLIQFAKENNIICLSTQYNGNNARYEWMCKSKYCHKWKRSFKRIRKSEILCQDCHHLEKYKQIAEKNNWVCLSTKREGLIKWQCEEGHYFEKNITDSNRYSCQECYLDKISYTLEDCCAIAYSRNGRCLSTTYLNQDELMIWECEFGHIWDAPLIRIKHSNSWCPECKIGKSHIKLHKILEKILELEANINYRKFKWLKDRYCLEIDIWFPALKLAVEYDGIQHFEPIDFAGRGEEWAIEQFKQIQQRDKLKNDLIAQHPNEIEHFIRFNYKESITEEYVKEKLIKKGIL